MCSLFSCRNSSAIMFPVLSWHPQGSCLTNWTRSQDLSVIGCSAHVKVTAFSIALIGILVLSSRHATCTVLKGLPAPWLDVTEDIGVPICPATSIEAPLCLFRFPQLQIPRTKECMCLHHSLEVYSKCLASLTSQYCIEM